MRIAAKIVPLLFFGLALSIHLAAQQPGAYHLVIADEARQPVRSASVVFFSGKQKPVASVVTDSTGRAALPAGGDSVLLIRVSCIGYFPFEKTIRLAAAAGADTIFLKPDAGRLSTVTVRSSRPLVVIQPDRYVLTIDGKVNFGNTVSEVLKKAPGISIVNDVVYLEGKTVMLQVNGKNMPLSGKELTSYISSSSSASVDQIELITTPPSSLDASFTGGVINLKLRKPKENGFKGNMTVTAGGRSTYPFSGLDGTINYRHQKISAYASAGVYEGRQVNESQTQRFFNTTPATMIDERTNGDTKTKSFYYTGGIDYYIDKKNTAGILVTGSFDNTRNRLFNRSGIYHNGHLDSVNRFDFQNPRNNSLAVFNLNYRRILDSLGQEISFDIDYDLVHSINEGDQSYLYLLPNESPYKSPYYVNQNTANSPRLFGFKSDYKKAVGKSVLEAGVKYASDKIRYRLDETRDQSSPATHVFINDAFNYDERVYAGYASLSGKLKKISYKAGVRGEYTDMNSYSFTQGQGIQRAYFNLFPTLSLSESLKGGHTLNLSFRRGIVRPRFNQLNPFKYYLSPFYYYTGNPLLQPYFPYTLRLGHSYKNKINTYIALNYSNQRITEISYVDPATFVTFTTKQNNGEMKGLSAGSSYINDIKPWWYTNSGASFSYSRFSFSPDAAAHSTTVLVNHSYSLYSTQRFSLPKKITLELFGYYSSPTYYDVTYTKSYWYVDFSAARKILHGDGELSLDINDIFYTNITRYEVKYADVNYQTRNKWDSRIYKLRFFFRFGNKNVKESRQRSTTATNEERSRTK